MADSPDLDRYIGILRASFWSEGDPEGRAFAPLADAYREKGDLNEAAALVSDGLGRHPQFATGHLVAARVARDLGDQVRAREHLDRVLDLDASNVFALMERAECSLAEGDRDGALLDLRDALRIEPGNANVRARVETAEEGERWQPPSPEDELVPDPGEGSDGPILTRTMGDIYARQGFVDEAIHVYEHLLERAPGDESLAARLEELRAASDSGGGDSAARKDDDAEPALAWDPGEPEYEPTVSSATIGQYFEDLLAWVPGAVPVESLAPGVVAEAVPIESLAPGSTTPTAAENLPSAEAGAASADNEGSEEGMDDFTRWLKGLGT